MVGSDQWKRMFQCLGDISRRRLLLALLEHNPQKEEVIVPEDVHVGESKLADLQTEYVHSHLPKLVEAGYIEWHQDEHTVVKGPRFDEIRPLLELIERHRDELPDGWV